MLGSLRSPSHPDRSSLRSSGLGKSQFFRRKPAARASIAGRRFGRDGRTWATQALDPLWAKQPTGGLLATLAELLDLDQVGCGTELRFVLVGRAQAFRRQVMREAPRDVIHALNLAVAESFPEYAAEVSR